MKASIATSISTLTRSLDRRLSAVAPMSPKGYLAQALSAQGHRGGLLARPTSTLSLSAQRAARSASSQLGRFLGKRHNYWRVQLAVRRWNKTYGKRSAPFLSVALRQVGVQVPRDVMIKGLSVSTITWGLSRYLEDTAGWNRVAQAQELAVGDIVFTADAPCCPDIPHHAFVFMGWQDAARQRARVIDNRGFMTVRPLRAQDCRPQVHSSHATKSDDDSPFAYALRAPSAAVARMRAAA